MSGRAICQSPTVGRCYQWNWLIKLSRLVRSKNIFSCLVVEIKLTIGKHCSKHEFVTPTATAVHKGEYNQPHLSSWHEWNWKCKFWVEFYTLKVVIFQGYAWPIQTFLIIVQQTIFHMWLRKAAALMQFNLSTGYDLSFKINESSSPVPPVTKDTHDIRNASHSERFAFIFFSTHRALVYVFDS